jgi:peptide/nickel transport system permease protein
MTLAAVVGIIARITRSALIDVGRFHLDRRRQGLSRGQIVRRHLLPNAAIPITTIIGLELGVQPGGTIIVG